MRRVSRSVSIGPGWTALTRTFSARPRSAMALVKFSSALFTAPTMAKSAEGVRAAAPMMLTTCPAPLSRSRGQAARVIATAPWNFKAKPSRKLVRQSEEIAALRRPGAIDEKIETAKAGGCRLHEPRRVADIAQIRPERERRRGIALPRQLLGEPVEQVLRARDERDGIAPLPEKGRDRAPDSLAGSGHDGAATRHVRSSRLLSGGEARRKSEPRQAASGDPRRAAFLGGRRPVLARQQRVQALRKLRHPVRLEDDREAIEVVVGVDIARGEKDLDARPLVLDDAREVGAAEAPRHLHVAEDEVDGAVAAQHRDGLIAVLGLADLEPERAQGRHRHLTDLVVVLDDEDRLAGAAARRHRKRPDRGAALLGRRRPRQEDADRRAGAGRAVDLDVAFGLAHETVDHAEAKAGALAALLRREEGLEDALLHLHRHASAGVADRDRDMVAALLARSEIAGAVVR